jgi:hypothetical protein
MLVTGGLTMLLGGWAFAGAQRDSLTKAGVSYAASLIAVGVLISFANCLSTFYGARFYLPVYTLFQMGLLLAISLVGKFFMERLGRERLESFKNPR